jgi:hypothetical protein
MQQTQVITNAEPISLRSAADVVITMGCGDAQSTRSTGLMDSLAIAKR